MLILQVVYIDSGLNMHSEDLLSCIDMPLKSNKRHPKGSSCIFPPFPCQQTDLQSGSSIIAENSIKRREETEHTLRKWILLAWDGK